MAGSVSMGYWVDEGDGTAGRAMSWEPSWSCCAAAGEEADDDDEQEAELEAAVEVAAGACLSVFVSLTWSMTEISSRRLWKGHS